MKRIRPCARCGAASSTKYCKPCRPLAYKELQARYKDRPYKKLHDNRTRPEMAQKMAERRAEMERAENEGWPPKASLNLGRSQQIPDDCPCEGCELFHFIRALLHELHSESSVPRVTGISMPDIPYSRQYK